MRTAQQLYDKVVSHLRQQNAKAYDEKTVMCRYRTSDGKSCAVGCLIPDESYSERMENKMLYFLISRNGVEWNFPTELVEEFKTHQGLLSELQSIHDDLEVDEWETHFQELAEKRNLQYTPKEQI
jgi:hypothetical protein